jgi:hypothetical protein
MMTMTVEEDFIKQKNDSIGWLVGGVCGGVRQLFANIMSMMIDYSIMLLLMIQWLANNNNTQY